MEFPWKSHLFFLPFPGPRSPRPHVRTAECFDPASGSWMSLPPMQERCPGKSRGCVAIGIFAALKTKWKLQVCLQRNHQNKTHGLETIQLTQNNMDKIDAFQIKCIRRILRIPPTFIDRSQTHQTVRDTASQYNVDMTRFSETWKIQKLKLFGYILRAQHNDPLRQVLFDYGTYSPRTFPTKRVGWPKMDWLQETLKDAYHTLGWTVPPANHINISHLVEAAISRSGSFSR